MPEAETGAQRERDKAKKRQRGDGVPPGGGTVSSEEGWELVTDCETAGVIDGETELPVRSHPYVPVGQVFAFNRSALRQWTRPAPSRAGRPGGNSSEEEL